MRKIYIKELTIISFAMILIHAVGMVYQIITNASLLAVSLKGLYILFYATFIFLLRKKVKIAPYFAYIMSLITIIISIIYFDLLNIVIAIIISIYSTKLYSSLNDNDSYIAKNNVKGKR